jgi:membrane-bound ClpP family serine protease
MVEPAEGAGMRSLMTSEATAVNVRGMIEVRSTRMKTIAIDDSPAMRNERVVVVDDSSAAVPVEAPTVPTPAEAGK